MSDYQPKVPYPRQLTNKETLDSISHWSSGVRNYFRRSPQYAVFFKRTTTWDYHKDNYGFEGEDKEDQADNLEAFLDTIAGFMPGPYITNKITQETTSIQSLWSVIKDHYGVTPSQSSFFDYMDIFPQKDERHIDLYDRMIYHSQNHLCKANTDGGPTAGGKLESDDVLTLSHKNLIALDWLRRINPRLIGIVKTEYSKQLKSGTPLAALVKDIAENVDSLLARYATNPNAINSVSAEPEPPYPTEDSLHINRVFNQSPYQGPRQTNFRGRGQFRGSFQNRPIFNQPRYRLPQFTANAQPRPQCQSCFSLGKRLSIKVDSHHSPQQCPQLLQVRSLQQDDQEPATEDPAHEPTEDGNNQKPTSCHSDISSKIRLIEQRFQTHSILKSKSPSAKVKLGNADTYAIIDEGSELCCIDFKFAKDNSILFSRTGESAVAAGSTRMLLMGETKEDVIIQLVPSKLNVSWNLCKCVIVLNLGCPILIGEPGKSANNILTDPVAKTIKTLNTNGKPVVIPYSKPCNNFNRSFLCRSEDATVLYPQQHIQVPIPASFKESEQVFFSPRSSCLDKSPPNQMCTVKKGSINLLNSSPYPIAISKNAHFGDIVPSFQPPQSTFSVQSLRPPPPKTQTPSEPVYQSFLSHTQVDPDNLLSSEWKERFNNLLLSYDSIIHPDPGCYNDYFGAVDCSLNFIKDPPASIKARLPSYSHDELTIMANLMDDMERMGVLCKPEDIGIVPKNVHTSYLVPKTDNSFRFVTDFTDLLPFIGKLEVVSPSIQQAKRILSSFKYLAELDLSNCFWQGMMSPSDSQYLATPHPFGGLRVYCREPQGIRNASEHNSEQLARIFGDLEKQKKMCRMADGLYVGGSTLQELYANLNEVLSRVKLANLTLKPSKIVICPKTTILFGWKKDGIYWSPTSHVISPLSQAPPPKTVKQLRGFIGAFRQLSETIKGYSAYLTSMEKYVGGKNSREHVMWSDELKADFDAAKKALLSLESIAIPKPSDTLHIYTDFSETTNAVGAHMVIQRGSEFINGGYFSARLEDCQTRWTPCEKECLGVKLGIVHYKPFITESNNRTIVHTDNLICVQAWNRLKQGVISSSSKIASFLSCLSENNVEIVHFPGSKTRVADYYSRNPTKCQEKRCQICTYAQEQISVGDLSKSMSITVSDLEDGSLKIPLSEKPTWLKLQKEDDTHRRLFNLITSGGLQPEPKLRGHMDLKLMYNLYRKGLLSIDQSGLITVKHIDTVTGLEYNAISVPKSLYPGLIQSLHIKLNHPSRAQLHKFANRHFHCIGTTQTIDSVHSSCEVCKSLATLPKIKDPYTTTENPIFGQHFSADVMISDGQKLFIAREKLSQFTCSSFIEDESTSSLRDAIISSVIEFMPISGCTIRVDPAPAFQSLNVLEKDTILSRYNIKLELGRVHNKNKNPIAENAIKEFRKERLRLNKHGGPLTELDRILINRNMNLRIRNRGLSAKEMMLRRDMTTNKPIDILDSDLAKAQLDSREASNSKLNEKSVDNSESSPKLSIGQSVMIRDDLNKLRGRQEYIIVAFKDDPNGRWCVLRKTEKGFRI